MRCDCSAIWLWQWSQSQKTLTDGAEFELDDCIHPERWKGQQLTNLPPDFCINSETTYVDTASADPDDTETILQSISFDATPSSDRINVTMHVIGNISTAINWTINYRQFGNGKTGEFPITGILFGNQTLALVGLMASTGYQICVQLTGRTTRNQHARCLEVTTLPETIVSYPVTEVAVAASVSTSTTLVVVILVCCCCPSIKCGKKNKKDQNNLPGDNSKDEVDKKSKALKFASSTSIDPASAAIWPNTEQSHSGQFSTFRGPAIARQPVDDQSHQVFQATCNYLRQRALDPSRGLGNRGNSHLLEITQHRRHSMTAQPPIYLTPMTDSQLNPSVTEQTRFTPGNNVRYFNASYGLTEFHPGQSSNYNPMGDQYKYCTWRPSKKIRHPPLLNSWTSYPDFLANSGSFQQHPLPPYQPAIAVPVYSMTTSCRTRRNRDRFYWSAAPAPIHTVEMQF